MNDKGFFRRMTVNSSLTVKLLLATISVLTIAIQPFRAVAGKTIAFSPMSTVYQERDILSAPDGQEQDRFGRSVAISADGLTLVTGASNDDIGAGTGQGSAYVYELVNGHYIFKQQLFVSGANVKEFGRSVAISGTSIAVGAPGENNDRGAVYVFTKNGASWVQQQRLSMFVSTDGDYFGYSVSLEGDTLAVGSVETVGFNSHQGSAVIFTRSGATWSQQAKLLANDGEAGDNFGTSVSLSGNTVLVGAPTDTIGFSANQGSAYVFVRNGASWSQQQKLTFVGAQPGDGIGYRVALDGDTALVSADSSKVGLNTFQGAAYVFTRSGTNWTKQAKLTANNGAPSDHFGWGVALRGDRALIGAFSKTILSTQFQGAAYVFDRSGNTWSEQQQLTPFVPQPGYFGYSVALGDNSAVVGAYVTNNNTGAIYTYRPLNSHPQISNVPSLNRTAGSGTTNPIIGQVTDAEQAPNTLQMTVNNAPSATTNGVTVSNLNVNASGVLSASVTVGCGASSASFTLRAIDSDGASGLGLLTVNVTPDTPPVLSYSLLHFVNQGSSTTIAPASGPGDNGTINFITLQSVTPAFSGNITVFPTGIVEITNAGPVGNYSITITAHDTCGLVTNTSFSLTVVNNGSVSPNNLQFYPLAHPVRLFDTRVGFTGCDSSAAKIECVT
ncbi:MAG: FG-GAP repeat protein, partial [Acidobacteria bacterium]|nr:FG-GAP repeat protein [Acidobacteriota bacterium]